MKRIAKKVSILLLFFICANAFAETEIKNIAESKAPKLLIKKWVTPRPPVRADIEQKVRVIKFWATWCPYCVRIIPRMIELTEKYSSKGVVFIALSQDSSASVVRKFIRDKEINYHIAMDAGLSKKFKFNGIPAVFVISHSGQIVWQGHPDLEGFEDAIEKAVELAPPPFLAGIELGPFEDLRSQLEGGRGFSRAYRRLKTQARNTDSEGTQKAAEIIQKIEEKINEQISKAQNLKQKEPLEAFRVFEEIARKFRGSDAARSAQNASRQLKSDPLLKNEIQASDDLERVQKILRRCRKCQNCEQFDLSCKDCIEFNSLAIRRVNEILNGISKNYSETKVVEPAKKLLQELDSANQLETKKADANDV